MRDIIALALMLVLALLVGIPPARAQDADALRREMEQMRKQFEAMQEQYKKALDSMSERLERMEKRPEPSAAAPPAPATPAPAAPPTTEMVTQQRPPGSEPSPLDLIKPREPFALYERRGAGQLLFDMGVTGDFVGNLTQHNVQKN
jgi:TolA-binding protein